MAFPESGFQPVTSSPPPRTVPWGPADVALAVVVVIVAAIVVTAPVAVAADLIGDDNVATGIILGASLFVEALLVGVAVFFTVAKYGSSFAALGFRRPERAGWWLPPVLVVGAWVIVLAYFAIVNALGIADLDGQSQFPDEIFDSSALLTMFAILALVAAPLTEEIFFRGFVFPGLRLRWGLFLGAAASGLLFGLAHILPALYIPFALVGMLFAFGYVYSGSLWVPVAAHFLFNGISFFVSLIVET